MYVIASYLFYLFYPLTFHFSFYSQYKLKKQGIGGVNLEHRPPSPSPPDGQGFESSRPRTYTLDLK